jgi:hypothetical protein
MGDGEHHACALRALCSDFCQIAVTLYEWEHIAERFEKATHYTEKALYKVLTIDIVPVITAELKVHWNSNRRVWLMI